MSLLEKLTHAVVVARYDSVHKTAARHGVTVVNAMCQSRNPVRTAIGDDDATSGGVCDGASRLWILHRAGITSPADLCKGDPTPALVDPINNAVLLADVKTAQTGGSSAGQILNMIPDLETLDQGTKLSSNNDTAQCASGAAAKFQGETELFAVLNFNLRVVGGGHVTAVHKNGSTLTYFDVNFGTFEMDTNKFAVWFTDYMSASRYNLAFGSVNFWAFKKG